jgi:hypothetical protein
VSSELNCVAHGLAKEALAINEKYVLLQDCPQCISNIISVEHCT